MAQGEKKNTSNPHFEVRRISDAKTLPAILTLEKICYPPEFQYPDAEEYYREKLQDPSSFHIFLKSGKKFAGYLLGVPFKSVYAELRRHDRKLKKGSGCYLETIGVDPQYGGWGGGSFLLEEFIGELKKEGFGTVSAHARISNGFNDKLKKKYTETILETHFLPHWYFGGGEAYEYIRWKV